MATQIQSVTIQANTTGDLVNVQYPLTQIAASFTSDLTIAVLGLQLTSSVLNPVVGGLGGVFAGKRVVNSSQINVNNSSDIWLSHLYQQSSSGVSQVSSTGFGDLNLMKLESGMGISIYLSTPNDVTFLVAATLTIWYSPL